jgi:hypothetical protein
MRVVDDFESGFGWQADEPEYMERTSHAVASGGKVWLFDAIDVEGLDERVAALGEPGGVIQLLDRHPRDCLAIAERLGVPLLITPHEAYDALMPIRVRWVLGWHEVAVYFADERTFALPVNGWRCTRCSVSFRRDGSTASTRFTSSAATARASTGTRRRRRSTRR